MVKLKLNHLHQPSTKKNHDYTSLLTALDYALLEQHFSRIIQIIWLGVGI